MAEESTVMAQAEGDRAYPRLSWRLFSVWYRHVRVYGEHLLSNGLPPFLEPLIFLTGIGLGLGRYIDEMAGVPYVTFLGSGLLSVAGMYTAAFECSFGTFVRMEFQKTYNGMLAAPITVNNLLVGELLWAGTKGWFFSFAVALMMGAFGIVPISDGIPASLLGFGTGLMFASLSMLITSFVKMINHFNFYFTGVISPMFFFTGVVFPIEELPTWLRPLVELLPLTHPVRLVRGICLGDLTAWALWDVAYMVLFIAIIGTLGVRRLRRRMVF